MHQLICHLLFLGFQGQKRLKRRHIGVLCKAAISQCLYDSLVVCMPTSDTEASLSRVSTNGERTVWQVQAHAVT